MSIRDRQSVSVARESFSVGGLAIVEAERLLVDVAEQMMGQALM